MLATAPPASSWTFVLLYAAFWAVLIPRSQGLDISYCSPDNNAGAYQGHFNQFQSNGACQEQCQGSFAFAVLQGFYCWCSNYVPTQQESTLNCNQQCPGFGSEWCGSTDASLYGYFLLSQGVPLGTSGSPTTATSAPSVSTPTSLPDSGPVSPTSNAAEQTLSPPVVTGRSSQSSDQTSSAGRTSAASRTSTSSSTRSTGSQSTSSSSSTSASSPSPSPTPSDIYTSVTTVTGQVRTVVVTPSASADATLGQGATGGGGGGGGVSTGKVVGIVLGVALGLGALIGIALWFWFRRRHQKLEAQRAPEASFISRPGDTSPSNHIPSRQVSQLSSSDLLGSKIPRLNTSGLTLGPDPRSAETTSPGFDRRSLGTDQRLNPYALYIHDESRLSNVSLQDNQDYSRQLQVANPDP